MARRSARKRPLVDIWHSLAGSANIPQHASLGRGGQRMRFHWRRRGTLATTVVPLTDHIVLSAVDAEEITTSGLVIPDSIKEKPQHGNVVAVGPGKMNEAGTMETIELKAGDRILYQKYTGQEITWEQALNSQQQLVPTHLDWDTKIELTPPPQPGVTKFI